MKLETQIVTGECPECNTLTMLVSFDTNLYRCVNCGHDLEQKVNGVIKYMLADKNTKMNLKNLDDGKLPKFGVNVYHKRTPKKRPGRHAKSYSKRIPRRKKSRGQGRRR